MADQSMRPPKLVIAYKKEDIQRVVSSVGEVHDVLTPAAQRRKQEAYQRHEK